MTAALAAWPAAAHAGDTVDLGPIIVTPGRMAQAEGRVGSDVTVITAKEIKDSGATQLTDVLRSVPGVHVYDNSTAKSTTVDIRGFGDTANRNVLVLVNGRKVNPVDISGPDFLQIPLGSVQRIEIIRGSSSVLYGDNATGGVINIITKQGKGRPRVRVGVRQGSYDTTIEDLEASGARKGVSYYMYTRDYSTSGYRRNSYLRAQDFDGQLDHRFSEGLKADIIASWHEDAYGLPGGLTAAELQDLGRRGSATPNDFAETRDRSIHGRIDVNPWPHADLGHFQTDLSYRARDTYAVFNTGGEFATKRGIDTVAFNEKYLLKRNVLGRPSDVVAGLDVYNDVNDILGSGTDTEDLTITKKELGGYVSAQVEALRHLFINGEVRHQRADYTFDQRKSTRLYVTRSPSVTVSGGGVRYVYAPGSNVFFNVQQTFRFLATDEWYDTYSGLNTNLKQQTGIQYEGGIKQTWHNAMTVSVTPYVLKLHHEIFYDPSAGGGFGANSNYGKTRRVGVEVHDRLDLARLVDTGRFDRFVLTAGYTYEDAQFIGGADAGKYVPEAPRNQADAGISLQYAKKLGLDLTGRYIGRQFAINDTANATPPIKAYFVFDGKVSWRFRRARVFLAVNNIFDKQYDTYVSKSASSVTKDYYPAPGRNVMVGMDVRF